MKDDRCPLPVNLLRRKKSFRIRNRENCPLQKPSDHVRTHMTLSVGWPARRTGLAVLEVLSTAGDCAGKPLLSLTNRLATAQLVAYSSPAKHRAFPTGVSPASPHRKISLRWGISLDGVIPLPGRMSQEERPGRHESLPIDSSGLAVAAPPTATSPRSALGSSTDSAPFATGPAIKAGSRKAPRHGHQSAPLRARPRRER